MLPVHTMHKDLRHLCSATDQTGCTCLMTNAVPFPTLRSVADHEVLWWCLIVAVPPSGTLRHEAGLPSGCAHELHTWSVSGKQDARSSSLAVRGQLQDI